MLGCPDSESETAVDTGCRRFFLQPFSPCVRMPDDWESVPKKSVILQGPRHGGPYKRVDFLEGLELALRGKVRDLVVSFGPLAKNTERYLVLKDQATKDRLMMASYVSVKEVSFRVRSADSSQFTVWVHWAIPFIPNNSAIAYTLNETCRECNVLSVVDERLSLKGFEGVAIGVMTGDSHDVPHTMLVVNPTTR